MIIAVVTAALCVKAVVSAEYSDEKTEVFLKWLFLKIPLYPSKKKKASAESAGNADEQPPDTENAEAAENAEATENSSENASSVSGESSSAEQTSPKKKKRDVSLLKLLYETEGIDGLIEILKRVFSYLGTFFGGLFRACIVEKFDLDIRCAKKDAAKTAIYYGEVSSVLFPMLGALASACTLKNYNINVYPDYLARYGEASFRIRFHVVPIRLLGIALALVIKLVFKVLLGPLIRISKTTKTNSVNTAQKTDEKNNNIRKSEVTNE